MRKYLYICILLLAASSCKVATTIADTASELFRGEVVARAGEHRLYRSQLESYIPSGVSAQDSANLARQYIESWAEDLLMLDMAEEQLSAQEKDVSRELEDYRRTLLKYRYEQRYINQRLDTLVKDEEIAAYYRDNAKKFALERPVVKARYLLIPAQSKSLKTLRRLSSADDEDSAVEAASLAAMAAIRYVDSADTWMDALALAQDAGMDYRKLLQAGKGHFADWTDEAGNLHLVYIADWIPEGKTAPLEYCTGRIRDLILSARKHELEAGLEKSVLEEARNNKKLVIY